MPMKVCPNCGRDFYTRATKVNFCSRACYDQSRAKLTRICPVCENIFIARSATHTCCSIACRSLLQSRADSKSVFTCKWCQKEFVEWAYRQPRFCSRQCNAEWSSRQPKPTTRRAGVVPERGANWKLQRRAALERDGYKCAICGRKMLAGKRRNIHVHHIQPYRLFAGDYLAANALPNLITLCSKCHTQVERLGYPCPQPLL